MTAAPQHPDAGLTPAFVAPAHACDAHFHIFGPAEIYPHVTVDFATRRLTRRYNDFVTVARRLGFERLVWCSRAPMGSIIPACSMP